jgi:hypothetical protein
MRPIVIMPPRFFVEGPGPMKLKKILWFSLGVAAVVAGLLALRKKR